MIEDIKKFKDVGEIWLIDNASTYGPLLEYLDTNPCNILRLGENLGHTAPWTSGLVKELNHGCYVVTDGDLGLSSVNRSVLRLMQSRLVRYPHLGKIGLGLDWRVVTQASPYFNHMMRYEAPRWKNASESGRVFDVAVDTTFAMYSNPDYFIGGGSLSYPYVARHYPWEIIDINENEEFKFYIENANSSSSYKSFLGL